MEALSELHKAFVATYIDPKHSKLAQKCLEAYELFNDPKNKAERPELEDWLKGMDVPALAEMLDSVESDDPPSECFTHLVVGFLILQYEE